MVDFYRVPLYFAAAGLAGLGLWLALTGQANALVLRFPFDPSDWLMFAGKDVAVGLILLAVAAVVIRRRQDRSIPETESGALAFTLGAALGRAVKSLLWSGQH